MSNFASVQNIWLYHSNPKSKWEYGWDVFQPGSLLRSRDRIWPAGNKSKRVAAGDLVCIYMKNIPPNRDGVYIVGRVCEVMTESREFKWRVDQSLSAQMLRRPVPKETVRKFFPRSYGPFMQKLAPTSHGEFLRLLEVGGKTTKLPSKAATDGRSLGDDGVDASTLSGLPHRSNAKDRAAV